MGHARRVESKMNIYTVRNNLVNTIRGKEDMLENLKSTLDVRDIGERMALIATRQFLEINIDELKKILADVELCVNDQAANSWIENPDRMGGQYTQEEIDRADRWI